MKKSGCNPRWDRLAGAGLRARETLRLIIARTMAADMDCQSALADIRQLATARAEDIRLALKHPEGGL